MNLPFVYKATEDNGNQRFIMILLNAIKTGQITAFDATVDDRFTTPMTFKQIAGNLVAAPHSIQIPDIANDPDGSKGLMRDTRSRKNSTRMISKDMRSRKNGYSTNNHPVSRSVSWASPPKRTLKILMAPYGCHPGILGILSRSSPHAG
jgi:hypothetical protein